MTKQKSYSNLDKKVNTFINNIYCRRDSNQHTARKIWKEINEKLTEDFKKSFKVEWSHYLIGELNYEEL